jgi:hypothetical protein
MTDYATHYLLIQCLLFATFFAFALSFFCIPVPLYFCAFECSCSKVFESSCFRAKIIHIFFIAQNRQLARLGKNNLALLSLHHGSALVGVRQ